MPKKKGLEEIHSPEGYMGKRYICTSCHGEGTLMDNFCRWCGQDFPRNIGDKVVITLEN